MINENILFSTKNYVSEAVITGGLTQTGHPLSSLKSMPLYEFCKFSGVLSSNSYAVLAFSTTKSFQIFSLIKTNLTNVAKWRVRVADSLADVTAAPTYDSGLVSCTPPFGAFGELPWGEFDWGDAPPPEYGQFFNKTAYLILEEPVFGKYVRIDIDDQLENEQGCISVARLWLGSIYQPSLNVEWGAEATVLDTTNTTEMESGVKTFGTRYQKRAISGSFELPEKEMYYNIYGNMYSVNGVSGELIAILKPLEPSMYMFNAVYGNLKDVEPISHPFWKYTTTKFVIEERV